MPLIAPPRLETGRALLFSGLRRHHSFADAELTIPDQWQDLQALLPLPSQQGAITYGAMCGSDPQAGVFEYLAGVEVEAFEDSDPELGRMRVPAQRYAVFTHRGPVTTLRATWEAIWREWLPTSGEQPANTPDFERYDPARFDIESRAGEIEIWFPLLEPQEVGLPQHDD